MRISDRDTMIAARARSLGCILVTNNTGEFSRVKGLSDRGLEIAMNDIIHGKEKLIPRVISAEPHMDYTLTVRVMFKKFPHTSGFT